MQTFTYSFIFKIIFRFGNIFVTLLLSIYLVPVIFYINQNKFLIFPLIISLIILYITNRNYLIYYKLLPYKIEADAEKMICSNFLFSKEVIIIYYKDIDMLKGGVFSGKSSGVMKVHDGKTKLQIGFSQKLINSEKLIALILSKVTKELYSEVIENITDRRHRRKTNPK